MLIKNIGIDAVDIERFKHWDQYKKNTLLRCFTTQELDYIFACPQKSAERFATRFAIKEAVFKNISPYIKDSFFAAARNIEVIKLETGDIACRANWNQLRCTSESIKHSAILVSVTRTSTLAIAIVMLEE